MNSLRILPLVVLLTACQGSIVSDAPGTDAGPGSGDAGDTPTADAGDTPPAPGTDAGEPPPPGTDAGPPPPPPPTMGAVSNASVLFIGHSLINWDMPSMVDGISLDAGRGHTWDAQIGNGGSIQAQWDHHREGVYARDEIPTGRYDTIVMTEAIPLIEHYMYSGSVEFAGRFYDMAQEARPGSRVYMYETWHETTLPDWRARIDSDRALWERIVDEVNSPRSGPEMLLIPAGTALGRFVDRVEAGSVPGISSRGQLFHDEIHLNDWGNYLIACVQFATIYRMSPAGLTRSTTDRWDAPYDAPPADAARIMQEVAWEVVASEPRSGVR